MKISAVVLAAGKSERMGRNKLLLPWEETTIVGHIVKALSAAGMEDVVVVTGHETDAVRDAVHELPCRTFVNLRHADGMGTSIAAGVKSCPPDAEGFLIVPGDMPAISISLIEEILRVATAGTLVVPRSGARMGQPVFFGRVCRNELESLDGDAGARRVLEAHRDHIQFVDVEDESVFDDIDSMEDYERQRPPE